MQLIETIRALNGKIYHLSYHKQRMQNSLRILGSDKILDLDNILYPPDYGLIQCRVLYDRDRIINVTYHPYTPRVIDTLKVVVDDTIEYSLKSADRSDLNKLFLKRGNSDDILIVKNGLVSDTSIANIAFFDGKQWLTPTTPLLMGTTRQRLLYEKKIVEKEIRIEDVLEFKKVAILNAMLIFHEVKDGIISEL